jgi:GTP-binding protein
VPGLIKGAHEGHGLGYQFLRHIERTKILVHLVDVSGASGRDPVEDFDTIRDELRRFDEQVAAKPQIVVATKIDALDDAARLDSLRRHVRKKRLPFVKISAVSGEGLDELLEIIWGGIVAAREAAAADLEPEAGDEGIDLITPSRLRHDA